MGNTITIAHVRQMLARGAGAQPSATPGPTVADVADQLRGMTPAAAPKPITQTTTSAPILTAAPAAAGDSQAADRPLPDDVPGHAALAAAGITTAAALAAVDDLTRIDGIGPATARKLAAWIEDQT